MKPEANAWLVYIGIVASLIVIAYVLLTIGPRERQRRAHADDARQRFDRICTSVTAPLKLAQNRVGRPETVEAGRDIAVVIAPVVAQCTGVAAHQTRLEALATSADAARDAAVIRDVLADVEGRR